VTLHVPGTSRTGLSDANIDNTIRLVNHHVEAWQVYWHDYYGKPDLACAANHIDRQTSINPAIKALSQLISGSKLTSSDHSGRFYPVSVAFSWVRGRDLTTRLHVNARILHGLKTARDVTKISDDRLLCLHRALRASRHLVQDTVQSAQVSGIGKFRRDTNRSG
jgi:hypothetical protein